MAEAPIPHQDHHGECPKDIEGIQSYGIRRHHRALQLQPPKGGLSHHEQRTEPHADQPADHVDGQPLKPKRLFHHAHGHPQGVEHLQVLLFVEQEHRQGSHDVERGYDEDEAQNGERGPLFGTVGLGDEFVLVVSGEGGDAGGLFAESFGQRTLHLLGHLRLGPSWQGFDFDPRHAPVSVQQVLHITQGQEQVSGVKVGVDGKRAAGMDGFCAEPPLSMTGELSAPNRGAHREQGGSRLSLFRANSTEPPSPGIRTSWRCLPRHKPLRQWRGQCGTRPGSVHRPPRRSRP